MTPTELVSRRFLRLHEAKSYVVLPLCFGAKTLGMAVFETGSPDGTVYEALTAEISAALEALMDRERQARAQARRDRLIEQATAEWQKLGLEGASSHQALGRVLTELMNSRVGADTLRAPASSQSKHVPMSSPQPALARGRH